MDDCQHYHTGLYYYCIVILHVVTIMFSILQCNISCIQKFIVDPLNKGTLADIFIDSQVCVHMVDIAIRDS